MSGNEAGIQYFEDGQNNDTFEHLCQHKRPRKDDRIAFYDTESDSWISATLSGNAVQGYRKYYNCIYDNGTPNGLYLYNDERWTLIENSRCENCIDGRQNAIGQLDGEYIPGSLSPTPETTPEKYEEGIRLGTDDYLDLTSEEESSVNILNKSFTGSPEWDAYGTHLERPLPSLQPLSSITHLDRRTDLSLVLPLTSTPILNHRPRVSACRRSLPLELEEATGEDTNNEENGTKLEEHATEDSKPPFLTRLNPFRKRDR